MCVCVCVLSSIFLVQHPSDIESNALHPFTLAYDWIIMNSVFV